MEAQEAAPERLTPGEARRQTADLRRLHEGGTLMERKAWLRTWLKRVEGGRSREGFVEFIAPFMIKQEGRPSSGGLLNLPVLSLNKNGSPSDAIERTFRACFSLPKRSNPGKNAIKRTRTPRIQEFLRRAEEYRRMLDREPGLSLRKLAARLGMKPERLCQILNLLKLSPAVRLAIGALPPAAGREHVTEYGLRRIAGLAPTAQMQAFRLMGRNGYG